MKRSRKAVRVKRAGSRTEPPARSARDPRAAKPRDPWRPTAIVGLGSSAGGLDALTKFFGAVSPESGMAFVIVAHLDPTHASLMAELIRRHTAMSVVQVEADTAVAANHVYCIPPGKYLSFSGRTLHLSATSEHGSVRMPIDFFLRSLAGAAWAPAIGIILSGTGSDGTIGLREVKAVGGLTIAQDPASAEHDGMPRSAIDSGAVDHVLSPDQIPAVLIEHVGRLRADGAGGIACSVQIEPDTLTELLDAVHGRTKLDLRAYKRSTLERRIGHRMMLRQLDRVPDYARLLIDDPHEAAALADDLLISVTSFFRDPEAWAFLQERVIRPLVLRTDPEAGLRVWVPGCATGEEAYSIAMLLAEELQVAQRTTSFQVFASDLDAGALEFARAGVYPESIAADVPPERLRRFFVNEKHSFRVTKRLRESVLFARQHLVADPPFPNLDLICCRNVLMYFEAGTYKHVLSLLNFALGENGHLFLGTAESIGQNEDLFEVISQRWRIYRRVGRTRLDRLRFPSVRTYAPGQPFVPSPRRPETAPPGALALQVLVERFVPASVLINRKHEIVYFGH